MKRLVFVLATIGLISCESVPEEKSEVFKTYFELTEEQETPPYGEVISFYIELAREFSSINIQTMGETDSGQPLHIVTYNPEADFNFQRIREDKLILLINNGIHPGESDGIDASMMLFRDFAMEKIKAPEGTVVVTIPVYNIGGALNRNSSTRVNQNGPIEYGFRGNARNYDLNRDFIKNDTRNAQSFARIYHLLQPDVFIDTHVSNGADYQYTLTHLFTQHNKLGGELGRFVDNTFRPELEVALSEQGWDMTPYVNVFNRSPREGFSEFFDHPRYSTGYTALWHTLGFMIETHMLKPYPKRVWGTYEVLRQAITLSDQHKDTIRELRRNMSERVKSLSHYPIRWALDSTKISRLNFKGYESEMVTSSVTGLQRLKYDRSKPYTSFVPFYDGYKSVDSISIPEGYVIPKGWEHILDFMSTNGIEAQVISKDTLMELEVYTIDSYGTYSSAYEGHYPHYNTQVVPQVKRVEVKAGDHYISTDQPGIRYLLETLEPGANDSFFNWNFFDVILQQKEGFSPYVFEDLAYEFLQTHDSIAKTFEQKKEEDEDFRLNAYAQLKWIYERTEHYEKAYRQYPVYRVPRAKSEESSLITK
ncbi:MAG: M14 family metallopeptidase [Eudoraea sp.]|nr:M14 family metallopeptidase [Eudoraea sp.]